MRVASYATVCLYATCLHLFVCKKPERHVYQFIWFTNHSHRASDGISKRQPSGPKVCARTSHLVRCVALFAVHSAVYRTVGFVPMPPAACLNGTCVHTRSSCPAGATCSTAPCFPPWAASPAQPQSHKALGSWRLPGRPPFVVDPPALLTWTGG